MTWLAAHAPVLQVVLPLLAAPVIVLLRGSARSFWVCAVAIAGAFGCAALVLAQAFAGADDTVYAMGSWPAPWGIEYRIDRLGAIFLVLVSAVAVLVMPYARGSIADELDEDQHYLFYALWCLCVGGLMGIAATGDAFNVFVFLEISSLATYALIALGRDRRALFAAYQYLIMGTVGATFIVIGIGVLYMMTGSLNLADMADRLVGLEKTRGALAAFAFLSVGIALKLALFPLHLWLPNAYTHAPSAVASLLSATATKVAVYLLIRFYYSVFGIDEVLAVQPVGQVLITLAVLGMFVASYTAIRQHDLRQMFAYSSVAQVGYIVLGLGLGTQAGLTASLAHVINHAVSKGALFMLLGLMAWRLGGVGLDRARGMARTMPWTSFGIVVCGLSLIGVPGTAGFTSKWALLIACVEAGQPVLLALTVLSSVLAMIYVWQFVRVAYFDEPEAAIKHRGHAALLRSVPTALMVGAVLVLGWYTVPSLGFAAEAAARLMPGVAP